MKVGILNRAKQAALQSQRFYIPFSISIPELNYLYFQNA
jgi:hypothetical protein